MDRVHVLLHHLQVNKHVFLISKVHFINLLYNNKHLSVDKLSSVYTFITY